jgi:hypothetical protein
MGLSAPLDPGLIRGRRFDSLLIHYTPIHYTPPRRSAHVAPRN